MISTIEGKTQTTSTIPPEINLSGTGFDLPAQLNLLKRTIEKDGGKETAAEQVRLDLEGLWHEYISKSPVLPIDVEISEDNKLRCKGYGKTLVEVTSEDERNGTVKQALIDLEKLISEATEKGSEELFLIVSPPGWSGYPGISYPDTQIYCYQVTRDKTISRTLVLKNLNIDDLESLRRAYPDMFGEECGQNLSESERIMSFTSRVVGAKNSDAHDVLNLIESHLGYDVDAHRQALEALPEIHKEAQAAIEDLMDFIKTSTDFSNEGIKEIGAQIGKTVIDLKAIFMWGRRPENKNEYQAATQAFAEDDGCNGGGLYLKSPTGDRRFDYEFNINAFCVVKNCISPMRGRLQKVGPCYICKACSIGITERTFKPVYGDQYKEAVDKAELETKQVDAFFATCVLIFMSLFD